MKVLRVKVELQTFVSFRLAEIEQVRPSQEVIELIDTCTRRVNLILKENERRLASGPAGQAYVRTRDLEVEYSLDAICVLLLKLKAARRARIQNTIEVEESAASNTTDGDRRIVETKDQDYCDLSVYTTSDDEPSTKRQTISKKAPSVQHDLISSNAASVEMHAPRPKKSSRQTLDQPNADRNSFQPTQNTQDDFSKTWMLRYNELAHHKEKYGHCKVSTKNSTLSNWVATQRQRYKAMSAEETRLLNELGFEWEPRPPKSKEGPGSNQERAIPKKWLIRYNELVQYKKKYGDCDVPYTSKDHLELRSWLYLQRRRKRGKTRCQPLIPKEVQLLEDLGVNWEGADTSRKRKEWDKWFEELVRYKEKYGTCNVSRNSKDHRALGSWVHKQRLRYRKTTSPKPTTLRSLSAEEVSRLEDVGFEFEGASVRQSRREEKWNKRYEELVEYKKKYGHCSVPYSKNSRTRKIKSKEFDALANWVSTQRTRYNNLQKGSKPLTEEEIRLLQELGFEWNRDKTQRGKRKGKR